MQNQRKMLIKTLNEVRAVLPTVVSGLSATSRLPNWLPVEEKYLVPVLGRGLYDQLQTAYDGTIGALANLLQRCQLVVAAYGYLGDLPAINVAITDYGVRGQATADVAQAFKWQYRELQAYLLEQGLSGTETLVQYLWANKADFPTWTSSDEYKQFEGLIIRTGSDFNSYYRLFQPMRTFYSMRSLLENVQYEFLVSGFGQELTTYLVQLAAPTEKEKRALQLVRSGVAFLTVKRAGEYHAVRQTDSGFTVLSDFGADRDSEQSGQASASAGTMERLLRALDRDGKQFLAKAKQALVALRSDSPTEGFVTAFDAGPLSKFINPEDRTTGNDTRKIFTL
jgi:hypothetical protein